ncbi:hypothetical protein CHLNCDRAFT_135039 [Chlorella variabilis]|uniref:Tyr recombinase domain-containing protein n=1 Tax=Chlorella variabilis TaxID=554065 RepID=E1ZHF2_CHLVA|nr:hypothetical protein CHLNCDRAFT_135039 [Chlorella variabilis]EFN54907.1 hypothetical protein CHLNCDRAFT_135039 [Chlorella variabilis]|eukprot:XP_005847009.1 hypothetical protein CHLNCDRAFT_135039 [Chlorella variabilis]
MRHTRHLWTRPGVLLASGSTSPSAAAVTPDTKVAAAISAACEQLGKPFPAAAVQALESNWYSTAAELAALPEETARSLGVPLRLKTAVADMLSSRSAPPTAAPAAARGAAAAVSGQQQAAQPPGSAKGFLSSAMQYFGSLMQPDGEVSWAALPIEERRSQKMARFNNPFSSAEKVSKRTKPERYAISLAEMSPALQAEFAAFHRFCTVRFFGAQSEPIAEVTAAKYADHLRGMLGYVHRERGVPLDALSFSQLLPSSEREGVSVVFDYILWLHAARNISVNTEGLVVRSAAAAAKFVYHSKSTVNPGRGETAYSDLGVVKELRAMSNAAKRQAKVAPRVSDEEKKWLDWPEYLQVCAELRLECAARDPNGRHRKPSAVAWSLQRYLRTLRELEVGRTLVRDREGRWVIRHGPQDYKTGRAYGERPPLAIAPHIYPELEAYMDKWRACLEPRHNFLFTQRNGEPLNEKSLYKLFWTTAYRLTGKRTNPHLVRDSIVTYLRGGDATERELEALALYMGHSVEMQRGVYDRRTKEQKVEPAVELLAELNRRAMSSASSGSDSEQ